MLNMTGHIPTNATGNATSIIPRAPIQAFVVDFRQWFQFGYEVPLYSYVVPVWSLITVCIYALMVFVFIKNKMTGKTYACLIAIAFCDSVGALCPSMAWFYVLGIHDHMYFLPLSWCRVFHYTAEVIPNILTGISLFLTVLLALTRYIIVAFPIKAKTRLSELRIKIGIFICFLIPLTMRFVQFFHYDYFGITVPAYRKSNETMQACAIRAQQWVFMDFFRFIAILQATYLFTLTVIPLVILVSTGILLITALVFVQRKRQNILNAGKTEREQKETRLSIATLVILLINLMYGICVIFVQTVDFLFLFFDIQVIENTKLRSVVAITNAAFWLLIPSNFVIIVCLSQDFRSGFKNVFGIHVSTTTTTSSTDTKMQDVHPISRI